MLWNQVIGSMQGLEDSLRPLVESCGYQWWGCEWVQEAGRRILRVYVDAEAGINVDDCALVSRQLSPALDVELPDEGEYDLEVSSPGMERPFFSLEQSVPFVGEQIKLSTREAVQGRRKFKGVLVSVDEESVCVEIGEAVVSVPGRLVHRFTLCPF